jgi:tRNA-splicing ligase RtcB (3'-phosphate/5'-hydroxy nucleic acid ligase)
MSNESYLKSISTHKKQFQTPRMKVPVVFHASEDLLPNEATFQELENLAKDKRIFHHIAAMSDVHSKEGRKNPTGTVAASKNYLFPQINDTAPNCGMRFLKTNLTDEDIQGEKLDAIFNELEKVIPTKTYFGTVIPYSLVIDICRKGVRAVKEYFKTKTKNEVENTFERGNFFGEIAEKETIFNAIPKFFLWIGKFRLGILGAAGNHFLDLMKISEIKDLEIAQKFGLKTGQYIFLMHTGSGLLGQYSSYMYTPKKKEHLSQKIMLDIGLFFFSSPLKSIYKKLFPKIREYAKKQEFFAYDDKTPEGKMFIDAHKASANHGFANRVILTHQLYNALEKTIGRDPELDLLYDMPHVYINRETHFGEKVWIHRNGSVRANGPSRMAHPLFSQTGEPVFIPSSMSTPAYIGVGTDENESGFFSAGHGTGRRREALGDKAKSKEELFNKMEKSQVKLYNAASSGVVFQDSGYYKNVEEVVSGMVENKIIKVVAKMEPVAVLMY